MKRHFAIALDGTKMTYECPVGHRYTKDHGKGPRHRQMGETFLKQMLRYWSRENGGCSASKGCPRCNRIMKAGGEV